MRVGLIARGCRPGSGIELYTWELARRLKRNHDVTVFSLAGRMAECGARMVAVPVSDFPHWWSVTAFSHRAGRLAQAANLEVVHAQGTDSAWGDVVTAHSCHAAGLRAYRKHDAGLVNRWRKCLNPSHRAILALERIVYPRARRLLPVSGRVARQVKAAYPDVVWQRLQVVPLGVDRNVYSPQRRLQQREVIRQRLGIRADQTAMALVANNPKEKGALRLLEAMARVNDPRLVFVIASSAAPDPALQRRARRLGLAAGIRWLAAAGDAMPAYAAADFYAALPEYESFGLCLLEAMACGLSLVVTRNAGVAEHLAPGREGLLLPALASPETVAAALRRMLVPEVRQRMAQPALATAAGLSWERMVSALEKIYEAVAREKYGRLERTQP